jgi:hypothetical protein
MRKIVQKRTSTLTGLVLLLAACGGRNIKLVEDIGGGRDVSQFTLTSLAGTRDGDKLNARAVFSKGGDDAIRLELRFSIGAPTRLESGTWNGSGDEGLVRERSVTFLGGQNGPPSLGGRFDLLGRDGSPRYRVNIPMQELKQKL